MQICCSARNFVHNYGNNINLRLGKFVNGIHSLCPKTVDSTNAYVVNVRLNLPLHVSWLWFWSNVVISQSIILPRKEFHHLCTLTFIIKFINLCKQFPVVLYSGIMFPELVFLIDQKLW